MSTAYCTLKRLVAFCKVAFAIPGRYAFPGQLVLNPANFSADRATGARSVLKRGWKAALWLGFDRCGIERGCCCCCGRGAADIPRFRAATAAGRILTRGRRFSTSYGERCYQRGQDGGVPGISLHLRSPIKVQRGCYGSTRLGDMRVQAKRLRFCFRQVIRLTSRASRSSPWAPREGRRAVGSVNRPPTRRIGRVSGNLAGNRT